jgi:hypothetical protein
MLVDHALDTLPDLSFRNHPVDRNAALDHVLCVVARYLPDPVRVVQQVSKCIELFLCALGTSRSACLGSIEQDFSLQLLVTFGIGENVHGLRLSCVSLGLCG